MLNLLSRIDRYMTSNMYEHGRYLLELEPLDEHARQDGRPCGDVRTAEPARGES
jgi:hypothetical protein